ncbi:MAG TPA: AAA family ATPase [Planctomycetota bacterium]|nr:AAA family ATPase [Planctomycetota bacterium]
MITQAEHVFAREEFAVRPDAAVAARTLAITGGSGGAGKTQIAVNLAAALAAMRHRVLLIDAHPNASNAALMLGVRTPLHLTDVASGRKSLADVAHEGLCGVTVAAAFAQPADLAHLPPWQRERLARGLAAAEFDFIVIDAPLDALDILAEELEPIIVCTPEPASLAGAYSVFKQIARQRPGSRAKLLANMADDEATERVYLAVAAISRRFLGTAPEYGGHVPADPAVEQACRRRAPFVVEFPDSPAGSAVRAIAARFCRSTLRRHESWIHQQGM